MWIKQHLVIPATYVGMAMGEQTVIQSHFAFLSMFRGKPMDITLDFARFCSGCAALGVRIISTVNLLDFIAGVFHYFYTLNDIGIAQPHFCSGRKAKVAFSWYLHKIITFNVKGFR